MINPLFRPPTPSSFVSQTLTHLSLSNNQVSSETAVLLGRALALKNCALELLDLSWNMIKSEGVKVRVCAMAIHGHSGHSVSSCLILLRCSEAGGLLRRAPG